MHQPEIDKEKLTAMIKKHQGRKWGLVYLLQEIQAEFGFIPPQSIEPMAAALNLFPSEIQGVITFYSGFSLEPKGKFVIKVCRGTACHVKGSRTVLRLMRKELDIDEGHTTPDYHFTLETAACLGACALAPTMMVNKSYFGKLSPPKVTTTLAAYGHGAPTEEPS